MAKRCNHYDVAFEELLRLLRRPYVSVNENRRALFRDASLKSMDFIVYSRQSPNLLVDVKGRRLAPRSQAWDSWTMEDDISSLMQWENVFGNGFRAMLVFAYDVTAPRAPEQHSLTWELLGRRYAFYGVWARDYAEVMQSHSPSWHTVNLPSPEFRKLRQPLLDVL
ncbi:HYExAFE family protein [Planctomicrobium piriforme]|uniref:Uncharacterized protein n=1 Tax=Planctomicrobium piriforme TaxID=1576369 RepID=A0A1I3FU00_9PLAN|nr:HYExAFE family protein [Planctomicrobium piriforme]SFI14720.1 hypothetical protein SAMN05421753_10630 [Planctomicrobium piriforme]